MKSIRLTTQDLVGGIWDDLDINLESEAQNRYAKVVFSAPNQEQDEDIVMIAQEILDEHS